jgi:hypothetical protein
MDEQSDGQAVLRRDRRIAQDAADMRQRDPEAVAHRRRLTIQLAQHRAYQRCIGEDDDEVHELIEGSYRTGAGRSQCACSASR